ncbi:MAG: hypothetical protein ACJ8M1_01530 [Chthoniobacterales bacterium]
MRRFDSDVGYELDQDMVARTIIVGVALLSASCDNPKSASPTKQPRSFVTIPSPLVRREWGEPRFNVCALLDPKEVAEAQNDEIKETKSAGGSDKSLYVSQCFYLKEDMQPAVEISVIEKDPATKGRSPVDLWKRMFTTTSASELDRDRDAEEADKSEERRRFPPVKINDLGAEAYWMPVGVLYVLRGDRILSIAVSGTDPSDAKLAKAKSLARAALGRL